MPITLGVYDTGESGVRLTSKNSGGTGGALGEGRCPQELGRGGAIGWGVCPPTSGLLLLPPALGRKGAPPAGTEIPLCYVRVL